MHRILTLAAAVLLASCQTVKPIPAPKIVYVTVEKIVEVPAKLLTTPPIPMPKAMTVEESVRMAKERKTGMEMCYADKEAIKQLPLKDKNGN